MIERRWGCPECGAERGVVAERRAIEAVAVAFVGAGDGSWSEAIEPSEATRYDLDEHYRCRGCLAVFDAPVPLSRSWWA